MNKELIRGIVIGVAMFGLLFLGLRYVIPLLPPMQIDRQQQEPQARQWTAPMQQWLQAGNRLVVDYVAVDGWCAVAIQRPATEEGAEASIQCIR